MASPTAGAASQCYRLCEIVREGAGAPSSACWTEAAFRRISSTLSMLVASTAGKTSGVPVTT
eukprot:5895260-Prymnesium_polylepis.1